MTRWFIDLLASDPVVLFLADVVLKATLLLCLAAIAAVLLRRASAAVRHRIWAVVLGTLVVLPVASWLIPGWKLPIVPAARVAGSPTDVAEPSGRPDVRLGSDAAETSEVPRIAEEHSSGTPSAAPDAGQESWAAEPSASVASPPAMASAAAVVDRALGPDRFRRGLAYLWAAGFLVILLPLLAGLTANELRRRQATVVTDTGWLDLLAELRGRLAIGRAIELLESEHEFIPLTWGIARPVVLLPFVARTWAEPTRRAVLLHELAHIQRADVACQLLGRLAAAVYWFHPLAWYALHRLRIECEFACDDCVVRAGERSSDYASRLLDLALALRAPRMAAALAMARTSKLESRITALFDETRSHLPLRSGAAWGTFCVAIAAMLVAAAMHSAPAIAEPQTAAASDAAGDQPEGDKQNRKAARGATDSEKGNKNPNAGIGPVPRPITHPISLAGMALDPDGKPIAGAKIYLASVWADWKRIAETVTGKDGRYEFRDVALPIERATTNNARDAGAFEVFGQAQGFGFAWRPRKSYFPERHGDTPGDQSGLDLPFTFQADDAIELDLKFSPSAPLSGRVVDDKGNPIAGTTLAIRYCEPLGVQPGRMRFGFSALNQREDVPLEMKLRTTDAQGRFAFTDLPKDCLFRIDVRPPNFPSRWVYAATSDEPQPDYQGATVLTGDLELRFVTPRDIPIQVIYGDTEKPAAKVLVEGFNALASSHFPSDAEGRVTLRLPPGEYRLNLLPAHKTPNLVTDEKLVVGEEAPREPRVARLRPAGLIEITVEDEETGEGLPNVDLWQERAVPVAANQPRPRELLSFRSYELETRIAHVERPRTDVKGKMRALVEPGEHVIGVGLETYPSEYAFPSRAATMQCEAGETVEITFKVRKRAAAAAVEAAADESDEPGEAVRNGKAAPNLAQPTTVDFDEVELEDALKFLAEYHDIVIREDADALRAAKISLADAPPVTLKLNGVSLRSVLQLMLEPCGLEARVGKGELVIVPRAPK